jgi:hypothetical protein
LEIQVLPWERHKKYDSVIPVNGIPTLPLWSLGIQWQYVYINKRLKKPAQPRLHSKRSHTITKKNDNINMGSTIAGSINARS